jgi:DNA replication factor GINS
MYSELYAAWQREIESPTLQPLPADFYVRVSEYLTRIREEAKAVLDKKTLKASLLDREQQNVNRVVKELLRVRYKKLVKTLSGGQKLPSDMLTTEETAIFSGFLPFAEAYRQLVMRLLQGQPSAAPEEVPQRRVTLRFLKPVPAIIGSDMKTYGPFMAEDVASVPVENARILTKQGFAENVEVS